MKKASLVILTVLSSLSFAKAQTWAEWFNQNSTQKKYLVEQIAALKMYQQYLSKGYSIAKGGLQTIQGFKNGEFGLHKAYFNSLRSVHPSIAHSQKVKDILLLESNAAEVRRLTLSQVTGSSFIDGDELAYIRTVLDRITKDCDYTLDELVQVTESGRMQMTDDERIKRIDLLLEQSRSHYRASKNFQTSTFQLIGNRSQQAIDIKSSQSINGIKK